MLVQHYGVTRHVRDKTTQGYTLFSRDFSDAVFLIDMDGEIVHQWKTTGGVTHFNYLRPNSNLFVCERLMEGPSIVSGKSGRMREYDWDGNLVWEHLDDHQHHDARRLDNGSCAYIAWKLLTEAEAAQVQGGLPGTECEEGIYGEAIREVDSKGNIVFEWANNDPDFLSKYAIGPLAPREEYGHANTVAPLPNGDYIVSVRVFDLLVIIDRQTGKLKWEYQNHMLGGQHDCHVLDNGNILVFANGHNTRGGGPNFSQVWEIDRASKEIVWRDHSRKNPLNFYSPHISGCQRLANGNTLICEGGKGGKGGKGCIFEVTPDGEVVWKYVSPHFGQHPLAGDVNWIFRAKRYTADSPEIRGRLP